MAFVYPPIGPYEYYSTAFCPPIVSHDTRVPQFRHTPEPWTPFVPMYTGTSAPNPTQDDSAINQTWYEEWEAEPRQFGSRWPLQLLNQPVAINLKTHRRDAKRVSLNHWDREHEPIGAAAQRLVLQKKQFDMERRALLLRAVKQEERRRKVREAAQNARVIDLTEDDMLEDEGSWRPEYVGYEQWSPSFATPLHDWTYS